MMAITVSPAVEQELAELIRHYPEDFKQAALLPVLHVMQREEGYLSTEVLAYVADLLCIPPSTVLAVATFYPMYYTEPVGRYVIKVCSTLSCALCGARELVQQIKDRLGIEVNETTADQRFTLTKVECLAACGTAPVMMINGEVYENLTPDKVNQILDSLQ